MAFGSGSFGGTVLGGDPPLFSGEYQRVAPPPAAYFDPLSREFLLDDEGRYRDMGTVEQQVALSFAVPRGSLAHAPDVGHDFLTLPRLGQAALEAEIDRRARIASPFAQLLAAGTVELVGVIEKAFPKDTEFRLGISWRKTGETQTRTTPIGAR